MSDFNKSLAQKIAELPQEEQDEIFRNFTDEEWEDLQYDWGFWGRPQQFVPEGPFIHAYIAGRGGGKTRAGAEFVRDRAMRFPRSRGLLVARTASDVSTVMISGESGIMAISPPSEMPEHKISQRRLVWPNGSQAQTFSSQEPSQLRGPQGHWAWGDESGSWLHGKDDSGLNTWENLQIATRLEYYDSSGIMHDPQIYLSTTPKRTPAIKDLIEKSEKEPNKVRIYRGSTYDNIGNLAAMQLEFLTSMYEGTDIGRQELMGELLEDVEGVLWDQDLLDSTRITKEVNPFRFPIRVVSVDPSVASNPGDECGIVVLGATNHRLLHKRHAFVLEDASLRGSPEEWARVVVDTARRYRAPVVVERNQGGHLVPMTINNLDPSIKVYTVWAGSSKKDRADPVAVQYARRHVHHIGHHFTLEDQMTTWDPENSKKSPDRVDALVWGVHATLIAPPKGLQPKRTRTASKITQATRLPHIDHKRRV